MELGCCGVWSREAGLIWCLTFAEGTGSGRSREARVPAVLEMLDIPYTGSDPLTLAATLDKPCAKQLVAPRDWRLLIGCWLMARSANFTAG